VRYDQRSSGLSDWAVEDLSFDARVSDLETVADGLGLDTFALFGLSHGGPAAIEYAVRHPERVTRLAVHGASPRGWPKRGQSMPEREAQMVLMEEGWAWDNPAYRNIHAVRLMPDATPVQLQWYSDAVQRSASADSAVRMAKASDDIDIVDRLEQVAVPTLVTHCTGDACIAFREGELIGAVIPGARFVSLDSRNHLLDQAEPAWQLLVEELRAFFDDPSAVGSSEELHRPSVLGLTPRQAEVVRLLAGGLTDQQIASTLSISARTVSNRVQGILERTNSANRTQAVARVIRGGL
jgi:pimeloyl-ACP methyl ester carboxylesterase/DNA-binding CsgD family transcriptional regulator